MNVQVMDQKENLYGHVENANQQVQGMSRTYRDALESRYEEKI